MNQFNARFIALLMVCLLSGCGGASSDNDKPDSNIEPNRDNNTSTTDPDDDIDPDKDAPDDASSSKATMIWDQESWEISDWG